MSLDDAPCIAVSTDTLGCVTGLSAAAVHALGYAPADAIGKLALAVGDGTGGTDDATPLLRLVEPCDATRRAVAAFVELASRELPLPADGTLIRSDGTCLPAILSLTSRRDPAGRAVGYLAIAMDAAGRTGTEDALRDSEERYRALYSDIPAMYFTVDADGTVLSVNEYGADRLGYAVTDLVGGSILRVFPPEEQQAATARLADCLADPGEVHTWEARKVRRDGSLVDVRETARAVRDRRGRPIVLVVCDDITERKRAERRDRALHGVALAAVEADTLAQGAPGVMRALCEALEFDAARVWELADHAGVLRVVDSWPPDRPDAGAGSRRRASLDGASLAARVARARSHEWVPDLAPGDAAPPGVRSAVAFPILLADGIVGVVELFSVRRREAEPDLGDLFATVGGQVGQVAGWERAETALAQSESKYRAIVEEAVEGIFQSTPSGRLLTANPSFARMLGYPSPEAMVAELTDIARQVYVDPARRAEMLQLIEARGSVRGFVVEMRRRDGTTLWVSETVRAVRGADGAMAYIEGRAEDISERRRAETELRDAHQRLLDIVEFLPDATFVIDAEQRVIAWNRAVEEMTGFRKEDLIGQGDHAYSIPWWGDRRPILIDMVGEEDPRWAGRYDRFERQGDRLFAEVFVPRLRRGEGAYVWVVASPLRDPAGNQVGAIESVRDVTDRREAENRLRESEELYRQLADMLPEAVVVHSAGKVRYLNPVAMRLFGIEPGADAVGIDIVSRVDPAYRDVSADRVRQMYLDRRPIERIEMAFLRMDGTRFDAETAGAPITYAGAPAGLTVITDITERKRAEQALRESEERYRQLTEMLPEAVVVHADGVVRYINPAGLRLFGFDRPDGQVVLDHIHPDYRATVRERMVRVYQHGQPAPRSESVFLRADGTPFDAQATTAPIVYEGEAAAISLIEDITERKHAEQALRESEERYRALYADIPSMYFTVAADGTVLSVNEFGASQLGYAAAELEGRSVLQVFPPECQAAASEHLAECLAAPGELHTWELRKIRKDGSLIDVRETARAVRDRQGDLIVLIVCEDITARRRAEDELFASRQMLRSVLDTIPQRVFWKDRDCVYLGANRQFAEDGRTTDPEDLIGKTDDELAWSAQAEMYRADDRQVMETDTPKLLYEERQVRSDGTSSWLSTSKVPLHDKDGNVIGVLGTYDDITDRKLAEAALRDSEERYRRITEAVTDYLFTVHVENGVAVETIHGHGCVGVTGYTSEELAADPGLWLRMVLPEDRPAVLDRARRILTGERVEPIEHRIVHKDGGVRWVRNTGVQQFGPDGTIVGYDGLIQDITERHALQDQLVQAQKMEAIGRLAGGVAHDFNNLLTSISGYSSLIRDTLDPGDPRTADLTEIDRAATRGAALTRQLLAFSRRQIVTPAVFDPNTSIAEMAPMLRRLLGEDITLVTALRSTGNVCVDPSQFAQVILNLSVNARDAMPDGGTLAIDTADAELDAAYAETTPSGVGGRYVRLTVSDTGKGMDAETVAQVFEPFFTTKEIGKGTGLGLATVYGIVKQAGGYIWVSSEPGHGATFKAYFPRIEAPAEIPAERHAGDVPPGGTETILVVEDDPAVRTFAKQVLERAGYTVLWAGSPDGALALARAPHGRIDLLFTDVVMPGINGRVLAGRLESILPDLRTVFTSGFTENGIVRDGVLEPDLRYLAKPYSARDLLVAIRAALDATEG